MLEHYWDRDWDSPISHRSQFEHLGQHNLSKQLVFFDDAHLQLNHGCERAVHMITQAIKSTGRFPVLCLDGNPHPAERYHRELCEHLDPRSFFMFHPDIRKEVSDEFANMAPWPSWLFYQQKNKNFQIDQSKHYRIGFLSGSSRYHRIKLFRDIRPYITDQDVVVVNKIGDFHHSVPNCELTPKEMEIWWQELPYSNRPEFYDYTGSGNTPPDNSGVNNHAAFTACVNITGETCNDHQVLLSEKTWKAYQSQCLVINFGPCQTTTTLKSFGFEIWDQFDQVGSHSYKTQLILAMMQRDDIEHLYYQHLPMIQHNFELFNSKSLTEKIAEPALSKLENLLI
jgi:hypothetical protein